MTFFSPRKLHYLYERRYSNMAENEDLRELFALAEMVGNDDFADIPPQQWPRASCTPSTVSQMKSTETTYQTQASTAAIFSGAVIHGGHFTVNFTGSTPQSMRPMSPPRKRRRAVIYDTSSSESSQN